MEGGFLTKKEEEVIREVLIQHNIRNYTILPDAPEGSLPQGTYPNEVSALSGFVITVEKIYAFWLDWEQDHYSLGHETGFWEELNNEDLKTLPRIAFEMQNKLREREISL